MQKASDGSQPCCFISPVPQESRKKKKRAEYVPSATPAFCPPPRRTLGSAHRGSPFKTPPQASAGLRQQVPGCRGCRAPHTRAPPPPPPHGRGGGAAQAAGRAPPAGPLRNRRRPPRAPPPPPPPPVPAAVMQCAAHRPTVSAPRPAPPPARPPIGRPPAAGGADWPRRGRQSRRGAAGMRAARPARRSADLLTHIPPRRRRRRTLAGGRAG